MGSAFCALHNVPRVPSGAVGRAKASMHSLAPAPKKRAHSVVEQSLCALRIERARVGPSKPQNYTGPAIPISGISYKKH